MGLIKKKSKTHQIIDQVDFQHLKEKIVGFAQKICRPRLPFLCKVLSLYGHADREGNVLFLKTNYPPC